MSGADRGRGVGRGRGKRKLESLAEPDKAALEKINQEKGDNTIGCASVILLPPVGGTGVGVAVDCLGTHKVPTGCLGQRSCV